MVILCFVCSVFGSDIGGAGGGRTELCRKRRGEGGVEKHSARPSAARRAKVSNHQSPTDHQSKAFVSTATINCFD